MNSPRNPSQNPAQIPAPDPAVIAHYAVHVLGVRLADWQRKALIDAVQGFGYASVAWADQLEDDQFEDPQSAGPLAAVGEVFHNMAQPPRTAEVAKGYNTGPAPQHAAKRSDTPIGDAVHPADTDPRSAG